MRKSAAIILSMAALVVFSSDAEARRFRLSFGKSSASTPAVPVSKPAAAAANAGATSGRGGTFVYMSTNQNRSDANQNRPMAAAPRGPIPERGPTLERGPLHEIASAVDPVPSMPEQLVEQALAQQSEPPAMQMTPVFVSHAAPAAKSVGRPAEKAVASAQPAKTVYCAKQASGACAPF